MIRRLLPMAGVIYVLIAAQPAQAAELTVTLTPEQPAVLITLAPGQLDAIAHTDQSCTTVTVDAYLVLLDPDGNTIAQNDDGAHDPNIDCVASRLTYDIPGDGYTLRVTSCCGRPYGTLRVEIRTGALAATTTTTTDPPETTTTEATTTTTTAPTTTVETTTTTTEPATTSTTQEPTTTSTSIAATIAPPTTPVSTLATLPSTTVPPIITASTSAPTTAPVEISTSTSSTTSSTAPISPKISNPTVKAAASNALAPGVTPEAQRAIVAVSLTMLMAAPTTRTKK